MSLKVKWGYIFWPRSSKVSGQKVLPCPFHCKPGPSGVSLESLRLENIPHVPANRGKVSQNQDARKDWKISPKLQEIEPKLVKITMRVRRSRLLDQSESEVGLYFGLEARNRTCDRSTCGHFYGNQGHENLV